MSTRRFIVRLEEDIVAKNKRIKKKRDKITEEEDKINRLRRSASRSHVIIKEEAICDTWWRASHTDTAPARAIIIIVLIITMIMMIIITTDDDYYYHN